MKRFERLEQLVEALGMEKTLEELVNAMSDDEMEDLYEYIAKMYEIGDEE